MQLLVSLFGMLCVALAILSIWRPGIAAALMLSVFATEQMLQSQFSWFVTHGNFINYTFGGLVALVAGSNYIRGSIRLNRQLSIATVCFLAFVLLSITWTIDEVQAVSIVRRSLPYLIGIGILGPLCVSEPKDVRDLLWTTCLFGGVLMLGVCLSPNTMGLYIRDEAGVLHRANYLALGEYCMVVGTVSLTLTLVTQDAKWRSVFLMVFLLAFTAIIRSGARGQAVGFLLACMVVFYGLNVWIKRQGISRTVHVVVIVFGLAIAMSTQFISNEEQYINRWQDSWSGSARSSGYADRLHAASALLTEYASNPAYLLIGMGVAASYQVIGFYCHIVPAEILAEFGVIGFLLYLFLLYRMREVCERSIKSPSKPKSIRMALLCIYALFVAQIVLQLKQGSALGMQGMLSTITLTAVISSFPAEQRRAKPMQHGNRHSQALSGTT